MCYVLSDEGDTSVCPHCTQLVVAGREWHVTAECQALRSRQPCSLCGHRSKSGMEQLPLQAHAVSAAICFCLLLISVQEKDETAEGLLQPGYHAHHLLSLGCLQFPQIVPWMV